MKRCIPLLALVMLWGIGSADAQETPLLPGLYEAESDALQSHYSGTGWVQVVDGDYSIMETATADDSVSFSVSGSQLVIYRELLAVDGATAEICVDELCTALTSISSTDQRGVPVAFPVEDGSVVTLTLESGTLRLDSFLVWPLLGELSEVPAPSPALEFVTLADGSIATVERSIRGGEIVQIALSTATAALLLILVVVTVWKR